MLSIFNKINFYSSLHQNLFYLALVQLQVNYLLYLLQNFFPFQNDCRRPHYVKIIYTGVCILMLPNWLVLLKITKKNVI